MDENVCFIDLENECIGYWISKDEIDIKENEIEEENIVSRGKFEIEGNVFNYIKIFY
jgi:hypothetical protein